MFWMALIIYIWAGLGFAMVLTTIRPLLNKEYKFTDIQLGLSTTVIWPALVIIFMFYKGDSSVKEGR